MNTPLCYVMRTLPVLLYPVLAVSTPEETVIVVMMCRQFYSSCRLEISFSVIVSSHNGIFMGFECVYS